MMVSCELYYDDVTVTSFINVKYGDVAAESIQNMKHLLFIFCGQKNILLFRFTVSAMDVWCKKFAHD